MSQSAKLISKSKFHFSGFVSQAGFISNVLKTVSKVLEINKAWLCLRSRVFHKIIGRGPGGFEAKLTLDTKTQNN
jgi:hypothetical protein